MMVFSSGTHFTAESIEPMQIKCLAQGHNILMQQVFELYIDVFRNRHLIHVTNMLLGWGLDVILSIF